MNNSRDNLSDEIITDRALREKAERAEEFLNMLETLQGSSPWYVYYNEDGSEKEANWGQNLRSILGYKGEEDFPNTFEAWARTIHPDERVDVIIDCEKQLKNKGVFDRTYRAVKKDGTIIMMKTQGTTKYYDNGKPRLYYGTIHDVTEEENLRQKEIENKAIMQHFINAYTSAYTVNLKDRTFEILHMAHEFKEVFTMNGNMDDMAAFVEEHVHPDDRELMRKMTDPDHIRELLKTQDTITFTEREQYNGLDRIMHVIIMRSFDADHCAIGFMDVTEELQKKQEQEQKVQRALQEAYEAAQLASNAKTTFLANMSHDIRTPMNAIIGMTAIADAHLNEPERIADCLKKINSAGRHLLGLINQVLDMSKIESGKVDLSEEEFNLSDLMDEVISMNHAAVKAKGHELIIRADNINHKNVVGDRTRLEQVFNNLLSNAIKYTPDGGKISISISEKQTNKDTVGCYEVVVEDNGIGMSDEFKDSIFEPFARAADSRALTSQGTGLGMPIARNIVRMMNGDITVESELNKGSTFTVTFTLKISESSIIDNDNPDLKTSGGAGKNAYDFTGRRILLAEDNELNREIALELLGMSGVEIETAEDGSICVDMFTSKDKGYYDLILMDIQMPVMGGYDAARAIRASGHADAETIPIIAMTANAFSTDVLAAFDAGMNGHISKPIDMATVMKTLEDAFK